MCQFNYKNQRYAVGLVFVCPLGDLIRRWQLLLVLMFTSGSLPVGLALTKPIVGFEILSFFVAIWSVTPVVYCCKATRKSIHSKVFVPLTADLAHSGQPWLSCWLARHTIIQCKLPLSCHFSFCWQSCCSLVDGFVSWMATFLSLALVLLSQVIRMAAGQLNIGSNCRNVR